MLVHWDEVESYDEKLGHLGGSWTPLGRALGTKGVGVNRVHVDPGTWSTPLHRETADEEIFVVLDGDGTLFLGDEEHAVRRGHVVHRPPATGIAHGWRAGEQGLTVLFYGTREPNDIIYYTRTNEIYFKGVRVTQKLGA